MSDIDEIKSKINAVDFVGEYVRLEKAGTHWRACCPFHSEKSPSFMVSEERQMWHCFGCGKGGDIFSFLMEIEGLSFREALKVLAEKAGVELTKGNFSQPGAKSDDKNRIFEILELATRFYEKQLWDGAGKEVALKYLFERGLTEETIKKFRLGFAPAGWKNVQEFLTSRRFEVDEIVKSGLLIQKDQSYQSSTQNSYDRFRNRIIFPISDTMGRIVGYTSRALPGEDTEAKYINTPETPVYHKSSILYGIDKAKQSIKENDFILLVEGNMDVIASNQAGMTNVVAVSGTALTNEQLDIIKRYTKNIKMFFDMDSAGQKAALRSAELAFQKDFNVSIVSAENGKDAAELVQKNKDEFLKIVNDSVLAMEYFFRKTLEKYNKKNIVDKKKIASELINIISNFSNEIEKYHWIKRLSEEIDVDSRIISDYLAKMNTFSNDKGNEIRNDFREIGSIDNLRRIDVIKEKIIGTMISSPEVWKKAVVENREELNRYLKEGMIKKILLEDGEKFGFRFEQIEDFSGNDLLRKMYFDSQQNKSGNEILADDWMMFESYMGELRKEIVKDEKKRIENEIRKAEMIGDKSLALKLTQELVEVSKEK